MYLFFITFVAFVLVMIAMAVGVIVGNRSIKGSCGGLNDLDGLSGACDICEGKKLCERRKELQRQALERN